MIEAVDDAGRLIKIPHAARRIVSLVPSLTETLFALGCGSAVVGVTRYCVEPAGKVQGIERIGGTKNPDLPRIVRLRPDLVIVNAEENRREDFEALDRRGLPVFVSFPRLVTDVAPLLVRLGALTGTDVQAARHTSRLTEFLTGLASEVPGPPLRVFCPIWKNPWMSFSRDTYAHDMLARAGGANVCANGPERYFHVTLEEIAATRPEVILLPDEPYVFSTNDLCDLEPLRATPAWQHDRVRFIDGKALSWYGARTAAGLRSLHAALATAR